MCVPRASPILVFPNSKTKLGIWVLEYTFSFSHYSPINRLPPTFPISPQDSHVFSPEICPLNLIFIGFFCFTVHPCFFSITSDLCPFLASFGAYSFCQSLFLPFFDPYLFITSSTPFNFKIRWCNIKTEPYCFKS